MIDNKYAKAIFDNFVENSHENNGENQEKFVKIKSKNISNEKTQISSNIQNNPSNNNEGKLLILNKRSKSNVVNELHLILNEKSQNIDESSNLSNKNKETVKDDIFDQELILTRSPSEKMKERKHQSHNKDNKIDNLNIFNRLIENERFSPPKESFRMNIKEIQEKNSKFNNLEELNNSTFLFDHKKENNFYLSLSNIKKECNDFLENSIDENFKKEFLTTEIPLNKDITKIEPDNSDKYKEENMDKYPNPIKTSIFNHKLCKYFLVVIILSILIIIKILV